MQNLEIFYETLSIISLIHCIKNLKYLINRNTVIHKTLSKEDESRLLEIISC